MDNSQTDKEEKTSWLSDYNLKNILLYVAISTIVGGGAGAGVVATKAVAQTQTVGISQDQADVRYVTKAEAERIKETREKQFEKIDKETLKTVVFEAYHKTDSERMDRMEKMMQQMLENQSRFR